MGVKPPIRSIRASGAIAVNLLAGAALRAGSRFAANHDHAPPADLEQAGICLVTPIPPSERSGGGRAVKELLDMLSHRVSVRLVDLSALAERTPRTRQALAETLLSGIPMQRTSACSLFAHAEVGRAALPGQPVFIEFSEGAALLLMTRRLNRFTVLRDHEILTRRFEGPVRSLPGRLARWRARSQAFLCRSFLLNVYSKVDLIVTLTEEDAEYVRRRFRVRPNKVVAIPVPFCNRTRARRAGGKVASGARKRPPGKDLLFLANLFHGPNLDGLEWFLRECAPHLDPGLTLHLCGLDGPLDGRQLSTGNLTVVRHGYVEDLERELGWVRVGVSPVVSGGGVRMKNLYLASTGRLVVTTPLGNEGIGLRDGIEAIIRSSGVGMAEALNDVARRPEEISRLGEGAAARVEEAYDPGRIWARYRREVFSPRGCAGSPRAGSRPSADRGEGT